MRRSTCRSSPAPSAPAPSCSPRWGGWCTVRATRRPGWPGRWAICSATPGSTTGWRYGAGCSPRSAASCYVVSLPTAGRLLREEREPHQRVDAGGAREIALEPVLEAPLQPGGEPAHTERELHADSAAQVELVGRFAATVEERHAREWTEITAGPVGLGIEVEEYAQLGTETPIAGKALILDVVVHGARLDGNHPAGGKPHPEALEREGELQAGRTVHLVREPSVEAELDALGLGSECGGERGRDEGEEYCRVSTCHEILLEGEWNGWIALVPPACRRHVWSRGQVSEWLKEPVSKTGIPARVSWVRIPPCPYVPVPPAGLCPRRLPPDRPLRSPVSGHGPAQRGGVPGPRARAVGRDRPLARAPPPLTPALTSRITACSGSSAASPGRAAASRPPSESARSCCWRCACRAALPGTASSALPASGSD